MNGLCAKLHWISSHLDGVTYEVYYFCNPQRGYTFDDSKFMTVIK